MRAVGFWAEKANALLESEIFHVYSEWHLKLGFPPPEGGLYTLASFFNKLIKIRK